MGVAEPPPVVVATFAPEVAPETEAQPISAPGAGGVHPVPLVADPLLLEPLPALVLLEPLPALELRALLVFPPAPLDATLLLEPRAPPLLVGDPLAEGGELEPPPFDDDAEDPAAPGGPESAPCPQAEASHIAAAAAVRP